MDIDELKCDLLDALTERLDEFILFRRLLHAHPEMSNQEHETARRLRECLDAAGILYRGGIAGEGIAALIRGGAGPVVGLRGDMDALRIEERTGLDCASQNPGVMHACGHDFHMAAVLGAGLLLHDFRERLPGAVKLIFQPAEENGPVGGARPMIAEGVLDEPAVDAIFACHVAPDLPLGRILVHDGAAAAAVDNFILAVKGKGGHAAYPHRTIDPVAMAAQIVLGLNTLVARTVDAADSVVVSVGMIHGGTRRSIIPDEVVMEGTIRTLSPETRLSIKAAVERLCQMHCAALGGSSALQWFESFEATVNYPAMARLARRGVDRMLGEGSAFSGAPTPMAAEDFGRFLQRVPGAFMWAGVGTGDGMNLHSPELAIADSALEVCIKAMLGTVLEYFFNNEETR